MKTLTTLTKNKNKTEGIQMTDRLLDTVKEKFGTSVAISLAKQAIEQNNFLIRDLKMKKNRIIGFCVISRLITWRLTKEGNTYWGNISNALDKEYSVSYSDLEEYAIKDINNKSIIPWLKALKIGEDYVKNADTKSIITNSVQKTLKEPNMTMIEPFNKGTLNIKGIIYQSAKGIIDTRPFIKALIEEEHNRILNQIKDTFVTEFKYSGYNIKIHHYVNQILALKTLLNNGSPVSISTSFMVDFYEYEKLLKEEKRTKLEDSYEWIASYLTQENMQKPEVTLFKSNKLHIFLRNGYIYLKDITKNVLYDTPVVYNKTTNSFHL